MIYFRPSIPGDSWLIRSDLRDAEVIELDAIGQTPEWCMTLGAQKSRALTLFISGEPAGMFGVIRSDEGNLLWGVFTKAIERHPIAFLRFTKRFVASLEFDVLNYVDARNTRAVSWFKWLGFEVSEPQPFGINGEPFHKFNTLKEAA